MCATKTFLVSTQPGGGFNFVLGVTPATEVGGCANIRGITNTPTGTHDDEDINSDYALQGAAIPTP